MARSWIKLIWNSVGVAVVVAAAQLGVAHGLGIVAWSPTANAGEGEWKALLTWVAFIYATAVLGGAAMGRATARRPGTAGPFGALAAAAFCASIGAGVAVTLVWLSVRGGLSPIHVYPDLVAVMAAGLGIIVGLVVALLALSFAPVMAGVRATIIWVWLVAIGSAAAGLANGETYAAPRLGVIDAPSVISPAWWSGPNLMIGMAVIVAVIVAGMARWVGARRGEVAVSGLIGPALVAASYVVAGRAGAGDHQVEPFRAALIAAGAGLFASVLVAAIPGKAGARSRLVVDDDADDEPLVGEIVHERPPFAAPATVPAQPNRFTEEDYATWIRDLGEHQRA